MHRQHLPAPPVTRTLSTLVLLLAAGAAAGTSTSAPERAAESLAASLADRVEAALVQPDLEPVVILEGVRSHASEDGRDLDLQIGRATQSPLREEFFVYANRLEITLERVRVDVVLHPGPGHHAAGAPLALLAGAFGDALATLFRDSAPREYTLDTLADAVLERTIGQVVLTPLEARLTSGRRGVELRAAKAVMVSETGALDLTNVTVTTPGGHRLDAEEAVLDRSGLLFATSGYRHIGGSPRRGDSATFETTADGRGLLNRGPVPAGALAGPQGRSGLALNAFLQTNPAMSAVFSARAAKRPRP